MTTIIICLSVIICVGFVCASFIHVNTDHIETKKLDDLKEKHDSLYSLVLKHNEKIKEIELLAEDAKKQLTAHNVAQGFKIGK